MIKVLILYYLSIKPTHGYEIQRFIQLSGTEQWMKIQSGSIYYALTKLEKEKCIQVLREERTGSRIRKIYEITELGQKQLQEEFRTELQAPIMNVGSFKFLIEPFLNIISEEEVTKLIKKHVAELGEQQKYWETWAAIKAGDESERLIQLSFEMTISSIQYQIRWHQELLEHIEQYRSQGNAMRDWILSFDPEDRADKKLSAADQTMEDLEKIKEMIEQDPSKAKDQITLILEQMKKDK